MARAQDLGWTSAELAMVQVALGAGSLAMGIQMTRGRLPQRTALAASLLFIMAATLLLLLMSIESLPASAVVAAGLGAALVRAAALDNGLVQASIPMNRIAGINGVLLTVSLAGAPVGYAMVGMLSTSMGSSDALRLLSVILLTSCVTLLLPAALRKPQISDFATSGAGCGSRAC
ncbi:MAG: hypothetical protein ACT4PP_01090 [Sporichthyaceae bacterium]